MEGVLGSIRLNATGRYGHAVGLGQKIGAEHGGVGGCKNGLFGVLHSAQEQIAAFAVQFSQDFVEQ